MSRNWPPSSELLIGDLSRFTGVKVPTIRYYEKIGLLAPPQRSQAQQRLYTMTDAELLLFISHARDLGITVDAIRELISLQYPACPQATAGGIAARQLAEIRGRIARLQSLEAELDRIVSTIRPSQENHVEVFKSLAEHGPCGAEIVCGT